MAGLLLLTTAFTCGGKVVISADDSDYGFTGGSSVSTGNRGNTARDGGGGGFGASGGAGAVPTCGPVDEALLSSSFTPCADGSRIGQSQSAAGATCEDVCCVFGFVGCSHRAAQADYDACVPDEPAQSGTCADEFAASWSSQCVCVP